MGGGTEGCLRKETRRRMLIPPVLPDLTVDEESGRMGGMEKIHLKDQDVDVVGQK